MKRRVGITGATGRLATILIRQLKDEYDLKLFSFEKPECTDAETLQTDKETYETTVVDLSDRDQVKGTSLTPHSLTISSPLPYSCPVTALH
jgi:dihydrodipicolinate reductase